MSEFHVRIIRVEEVLPHTNADKLEIVHVDGGYPVCVKKGDYKAGDLAAYLPIDSIVPDTEYFSFLAPQKVTMTDGTQVAWLPGTPVPEKYRRIKAKRLRGVFSMGMLVPITEIPVPRPPVVLKPGLNVQELLGVTKWEPEMEPVTWVSRKSWYDTLPWYKKLTTRLFWTRVKWFLKRGKMKGVSDNVPAPGKAQEFTDIEGYRKHKGLLIEGEEVILTEKIHGQNARFGYIDDVFYAGSHHYFKRRPEKGEPADNWWRVAKEQGLEAKMDTARQIMFCGEVAGAVQKGYDYGVPKGQLDVWFFGALDVNTGNYLDYDDFVNLATGLGLKIAPLLYRGPWHPELKAFAEGNSTLGKHLREGFVVQPEYERRDLRFGRVILKYVGEGYLIDQGKQ